MLLRHALSIGAAIAVVFSFLLFGGAANAARIVKTGGTVQQIWIVNSNDSYSIGGSRHFSKLPNAQIKIAVPKGQSQLVTARFTAQSSCGGGRRGIRCEMNIFAGNEALNYRVFFDTVATVGGASSPHRGNAYARALALNGSAVLPPGTYKLYVAIRSGQNDTRFILTNWHLTVVRHALPVKR